jgi:hypothetical protein
VSTQVNIEYENEIGRGVHTGPFDRYPASAGVRRRAELLAAAFEGKRGEKYLSKEREIDQSVRVVSEVNAVSEARSIPHDRRRLVQHRLANSGPFSMM